MDSLDGILWPAARESQKPKSALEELQKEDSGRWETNSELAKFIISITKIW